MYRKLAVVTIIVLLLSLAFASVSSAQTGTGTQGNQSQNGNNAQNGNQGNGPESAFTSLGSSRSLQAGQQMWFRFEYAGDNSPIQIRLRNASNMQFSVWTQQDIQNAAGNYGATAMPVGRSTSNQGFGGDQYWTGSFNTPGTYYVMVENANGGQGGKFTLEITGSGVSFRGANSKTGTSQDNENKESAKTAAGEKSESNKTSSSSSSQTGSSNNNSSQTGANNNTSTSSSSQTGTNNNTSTSSSSQTGSNNTSSSNSSTARGGVAPSTLPTTGGEMASVFPMLLGGMGALSVAAGAFLRRKK